MNRKRYVGNLAYNFGFVERAFEADAQAAIERIHEKPFGGRALAV